MLAPIFLLACGTGPIVKPDRCPQVCIAATLSEQALAAREDLPPLVKSQMIDSVYLAAKALGCGCR